MNFQGGAQEPVRHIVFDVGRVLLHWDPELAYLERIPNAQERRWFLDNVCSNSWNVEQDRGRNWQEAEAVLIAQYPGHEENIRAYRANWSSMVPHAIDGTVAVLGKLIENGIDVTLLTNFAADTFVEAKQRFEFLDWPRGATVSGKVGMLKPESEIYDHHARSFDLERNATLFIDDSRKNIDGAIAAGWQAIVFESSGKLEVHLQELGLLT